MENRPPAFQFYPADYLSDINVILMDNQQGGCYLKLMSHEWLAFGKGIPREVNDLAKLCGESEEKMAMLWEGIKKCFNPHPKDDTKLIHPRLEKERKKINDNRKKRAKAGKQGAKARWQTHSNRIAKTMAKNGSSSSITTSITTALKTIDDDKNPSPPPSTKQAIDYYHKHFLETFGVKPMIDGGKDGALLKKIIKHYGLDTTLELLKKFIDSDEKFIKSTGRTIGVFYTVINKLLVGEEPTTGFTKSLKNITENRETQNGTVNGKNIRLGASNVVDIRAEDRGTNTDTGMVEFGK